MFWRRHYDISGKWYGTITYGRRYRENAGKELLFEADLTMDGRLVKGTAVDTGGWGISPGPASISGSLIGKKLSFLKQYSVRAYWLDGVPTIDESQKGRFISYIGIYDPDTDSFKGVWQYEYGEFAVANGIIAKTGGSGTWVMSRMLQTVVPAGF